jgi:RNA polymerase sigma-70 factor (ECF subfamily)
MNLQEENELLLLLQKGDSDAFKELFFLFHKKVYSLAFRLLGSAPQAEDVVQNVFMAIWNQRVNLRITNSFATYLLGITRNIVCDYIKNKISHEAFVAYSLKNNKDYSFITEETILYNELTERLKKYIAELPERRREIFLLHRMENMTYKDIAQKLGITENTVDTQIRHALTYLKSRITFNI